MSFVTQFGVIADDLTGAMDAGLQFHQAGLRTLVLFRNVPASGDMVLVVDTETRGMTADLAYQTVRRITRQLKARRIYKKIDSTLRGHIGQELDAVMDELDAERALVTPAFPEIGRTVENGRLLVGGQALMDTDFSTDPSCPSTDHIPTLIDSQSRRSVAHIGVAVTDQGTAALRNAIQRQAAELVVIDAVTKEHLRSVAGTAAILGVPTVVCGSAGLAQALPLASGMPRMTRRLTPQPSRSELPVLLVVGSLREATRRQVERIMQSQRVCLIEVDPTRLAASLGCALGSAQECLRAGEDVVLTTAFSQFVPEQAAAVSASLAWAAAKLVERHVLSGVVLCGGAIAASVSQALGIRTIEVEGELTPGVPVGRVAEGPCEGRKLVTKAGGFGDDHSLLRAVQYLRGEA